jgi:hypothetical protein
MMHKESHSPVDPAGGFFNVKEFSLLSPIDP